MKRGVIILNPAAGRGRSLRQLARLQQFCAGSGAEWDLWLTTGAGNARSLAALAAADGVEVVVAAGGDGTLSEVLNGLVMSARSGAGCETGWETGRLPCLSVLPLGTGNDFARFAGITRDHSTTLDYLEQGVRHSLDIGRVDVGGGTHAFLNISGCGFDALVAERINRSRKHPVLRHVKGTPAYLGALLAELGTLSPARLHLEIDGKVWQEQALLCSVANAQSYGGGMKIAPGARADDGLFEVCIIKAAGRGEFLRALPSVFSGAHIHHPKVEMLRGSIVSMQSDTPLPVLVDGEVLGNTPARFSFLKERIPFLLPPDSKLLPAG